jgi:DNA-binding transcriptional MocR family regulator
MPKNEHLEKTAYTQGNFTIIPNRFFDDSQDYRMKSVFHHLLCFRNTKTGQCNPSQQTLAKKVGMSKPTVERQIRKLKAFKWIRVTRTRTSCQYDFPHLDSSLVMNHGVVAEDSSKEDLGFVTRDGSYSSPVTNKQEEVNKKKEQDLLLHNGRECRMVNDTIMVKTSGNKWEPYKNEDDQLFSSGSLRGVEAKNAFLKGTG